jgi:hypothetical protein
VNPEYDGLAHHLALKRALDGEQERLGALGVGVSAIA